MTIGSVPATSVTMLDGLGKGDPQRWKRFIALYGPLVYRLAKRKGLDRDAADELCQSFFCLMVKEIPKFQYDPQRGRFRGWLFMVAVNLIRKSFRGPKRREVALGGLAELEVQEREAKDWWDTAEGIRLLQLAMDNLRHEMQGEGKSEQYEVFRLLTFEGKSGEDMGRDFGLTRNQVYGIKFRLLKRLKAIAENMARDIEGDWNVY